MTTKTADVARVILKEIPLMQLSHVVGLRGANAMGDGCGGGCNGGNSCLDKFGHTGLTDHEIKAALKDTAGLNAALKHAIGNFTI